MARMDEGTGEWRELHNKDLNDLCFSPNIVRAIKSRRIRWAGHIACVGMRRGVHRVLVGSLRGKDYLEDPGVDGRIILKWIFMKWNGVAWTGLIWLRIGTGSGHL